MRAKWGIVAAVILTLLAGLAIADSSTTNLLLTDQTTGGNANTWGDIADANFQTIDDKLGDVQAIATTGGTTTLSSSQELVATLNVTGTLSSNAILEFSGRGGFWIVRNGTTGSFTLTAKTSGNTGVEITQGSTAIIYCCVSSDIARLAEPSSRFVGEMFDYAGTSCPSGSLETYGQAVSRTTYSDLFAIISTTYGIGDGSLTFNMPDLRGRVTAGEDDMGGSSANRLTAATDSLNGDTLGATGGVETQAIAEAELPSHTHGAGSYAGATHTHSFSATSGNDSVTHTHTGTTDAGGVHNHDNGSSANNGSVNVENGSNASVADNGGAADTSTDGSHTHGFTTGTNSASHTHTVSGTTGASGSLTVSGTSSATGSGTAMSVVQPTIVLRKCIYTGV
jgi:microcystin-dependent protein